MPTTPAAAPRSLLAALCALAFALLAGCASRPQPAPVPGGPGVPPVVPQTGPLTGRDGVPADAPPPARLLAIPDPEPRVEAPRAGGPNKPYEVLGQSYTPVTGDPVVRERGFASWYGRKFHGRRTASGEVYNMYAMTAAHKTMPLPSYARVRNPANGREIVVRVNDRGPFHRDRVIDLSYTAALKLDAHRGLTMVEIERITNDEIRGGRWRRGAEPPAAPANRPAGPPAGEPQPVPPVVPVDGGPAVTPPPEDPPSPRAQLAGFWVQLGAFRALDGATSFQRHIASELEWLSPMLAIVPDRQLHRLQAGPYATRAQAQEAADRVRAQLALVPVIVERR
jgi:rare lipoprotein A